MNLRKIKRYSKVLLLNISIFLLVLGSPLSVYADTSAPLAQSAGTSSSESPVSPSSTERVTPPPEKTYTYDTTTKHWNTSEWQYDNTTNSYTPVPTTAPVNPVVAPTTLTAPSTTTITPTDNSTATATSSASTNADTNTSAAIANALNSTATSGDADVLHNTTAGDATTGNAAATATIVNDVNSIVTNKNNAPAVDFVSNVMGDVSGDIILQPALLKALLESNSTPPTQNVESADNIQSTDQTAIQNDLSLSATSGDATVASNTQAGNATTGSANTVADVINIINSMVVANQSFVGTVNIYGNLNGDILIAPDFIPQLLASNTTPQSNTTTQNTTAATTNNTQSIVNNVKLAANSGEAYVTGNTDAGNATTGNSSTNLVVFNLTGHAIVAKNSLLVFVNVLGKWVGAIVDAPTGATAAAIGNGVSSQGTVTPDMTINVNNTAAIVNNIDLSSISGSATIANNTIAGNATTGNATASANILNINGSEMALSGWFGILFINVFGGWIGSFGIDTSAGNTILAHQTNSTHLNVIRFVPHNPTDKQPPANLIITPSAAVPAYSNDSTPAVTASAMLLPGKTQLSTPSSTPEPAKTHNDLISMLGSLILLGVSAYGLRRFVK